MRRREFITLLGGAAVSWPLAARAQQPAMPVIGYLGSQSPDVTADLLRGFRQGLKDGGYIEDQTVLVDYRWAENQTDRLPALAADLVRRRVAVIAASGGPASESAAKATTSIPIVFMVAEDPVRMGLVASLARPGGNLTGVNFFAAELAAKRLALLRELVPAAGRVAVLLNPAEVAIAAANFARRGNSRPRYGAGNSSLQRPHERRNRCCLRSDRARTAGRGIHQQWSFVYQPACPVGPPRNAPQNSRDPRVAFLSRSRGLISYGASVPDAHRQAGVYVGRILKGAKPADLPVVQATKFELVINHQTARLLGLTGPPSLLSTADEVIE
jgi:putative tryptophan/tyrosine transport system substrate-binding protein